MQKGLYDIDLLLDDRADLCLERRDTILDSPMSDQIPDGAKYSGRRGKAPIPVIITRGKKWRLAAAPDGRPADLRMAGVETGVDAIREPDGTGIFYRPFRWEYDSFRRTGLDSDEWLIDIDDALTFEGHAGAPEGLRPVYFHLYPAKGRLYLQYWYFFTMNDNRAETKNRVWHEGDWEHVAIELVHDGGEIVPTAVDFYFHESGIVRRAADCWWSETALPTYDGLQKGFDARHPHLHVWLAANSHGSYNRYDPVYDLEIRAFLGTEIDHWSDNLDYEPAGRDEYFSYDFLENMGEAGERGDLILPRGSSKPWIAFQGRFGRYWRSVFVSTPSPGPLATRPEFYSFHDSGEGERWGLATKNHLFYRLIVSWKQDRPAGD